MKPLVLRYVRLPILLAGLGGRREGLSLRHRALLARFAASGADDRVLPGPFRNLSRLVFLAWQLAHLLSLNIAERALQVVERLLRLPAIVTGEFERNATGRASSRAARDHLLHPNRNLPVTTGALYVNGQFLHRCLLVGVTLTILRLCLQL